ncbi:hypothetical protein Ancab_017838 [Ancistrocladus abbreviatus]
MMRFLLPIAFVTLLLPSKTLSSSASARKDHGFALGQQSSTVEQPADKQMAAGSKDGFLFRWQKLGVVRKKGKRYTSGGRCYARCRGRSPSSAATAITLPHTYSSVLLLHVVVGVVGHLMMFDFFW